MKKAKVLILFAVALVLSGCSVFTVVDIPNTGSFSKSYAEQVSDPSIVPDGTGTGNFSVLVVTDAHFGRVSDDSRTFDKHSEIEDWYLSLSADEKPDYTINIGDSTDNSQESQYFDSLAFLNTISANQFLSVIGNHDNRASGRASYKEIFKRPTYFKMELHGISFYFLDNSNRTLGQVQMADLKKTMAYDPNRKVVVAHYPIYPTSDLIYASMDDPIEVSDMLTLFKRSNVDLVLTGHYHIGQKISKYSESCTELVLRPCHGRTGSISDSPMASWYVLNFDMAEKKCTVLYYSLTKDQTVPSTPSVWGVFPIS